MAPFAATPELAHDFVGRRGQMRFPPSFRLESTEELEMGRAALFRVSRISSTSGRLVAASSFLNEGLSPHPSRRSETCTWNTLLSSKASASQRAAAFLSSRGSAFVASSQEAPQAATEPGTMQGYPDGEHLKNDKGLKPGETEASVALEEERAKMSKDELEHEDDDLPTYDPETGERMPKPSVDDVSKLTEKRERAYWDDPPEDPKNIYQTKGVIGPVRAHRKFAGGHNKVMNRLTVGSKARIDNVTSEDGADLNGKMCRIMGRDDAVDKFMVQAEDGRKAKLPPHMLTPQLEDAASREEAAKLAESIGPRKTGLT